MQRIDEIVVVMPARNERELIADALDAVGEARAAAEASARVAVRVVVVLDSCTDGTEGIARARHDLTVVEVEASNVGAARAAGVGAGVAASGVPLDRLWITTTDADSRVDPDWLVEHIALARAGAELVVGVIRPDPRDLSDEQMAAWWSRANEASRADDPGGVHGANLGIRGDLYSRLAGFSPLVVGEDVDLVERASRMGAQIVYARAGQVVTSARTHGRAPHGYAEFVRLHY